MVLLKGLSSKGFVFYTNLNSPKSFDLKENSKAAMCFHWKSIQRQIRILGKLSQVYQQLDRRERIKDFPRLLNYLVETSSRYAELKNMTFAISSLQDTLNKKMDKIFS